MYLVLVVLGHNVVGQPPPPPLPSTTQVLSAQLKILNPNAAAATTTLPPPLIHLNNLDMMSKFISQETDFEFCSKLFNFSRIPEGEKSVHYLFTTILAPVTSLIVTTVVLVQGSCLAWLWWFEKKNGTPELDTKPCTTTQSSRGG